MTYHQLPDPFEQWSEVLTTAAMRAIHTWWDTGLSTTLYPTLLADGDEENTPPPVLEALLATIAAWEAAANQELRPLLMGLFARRLADLAHERDLDLTPLTVDPTPQMIDLLKEVSDALQAVSISLDDVDTVFTIPTWVDTIDDAATTSINLVKGMPESTYRDIITSLAAAVRDGATPAERAAIVADYLNPTASKGREQWEQRAKRIARTETNRITNAADLIAARTEAATTGEELHKVWIAGMDSRTRDSHFSADGQRVPIDGKFLIAGHEADYPGDPTLPAAESINCRCTTVILAADEPLPDDEDRHTERERSDGSRRDPNAEVSRRAADGVTRARDDASHTVTAAIDKEPHMRKTFSGVLAPIGTPTGDGRIIDSDAVVTFREFPLPLMFQRATSDGHDTAIVVGKITAATADGGAINATGEFFDTPDATEAATLVAEGVIRPSVDMCDMLTEWTITDQKGHQVNPERDTWEDSWQETMHVRSATIMAATLVAKPAFAEAKLILGEDTTSALDPGEQAALVAAAGVMMAPKAPAEAFTDPHLDGPTALTVTDDGRVYGHLALWDTAHIGMPGRKVTPPHSTTDYALFHVSTVETTTGPISCGRLTVGCGHAEARATSHAATAHYDETGTTWAFVRAGEDAHGIWVAGITNPDADEVSIRAGAAAPLSGDWRCVGGNLELVAALSVNTPGFPVPRAYAATTGAELSLVASGVVPRQTPHAMLADAVAEGLRRHEEYQEEKQAQAQRAYAARRLAASVLRAQITK